MPRTLTNNRNLPLPIFLAIKGDTYVSRGDISTTTLIDAPYYRILKKYNHYEEDASESIWALMGSAIHSVIERASSHELGYNFIPEKQMSIKISGYSYGEIELTGTSDIIEKFDDTDSTGQVILHDIKNIFVWVAKLGKNSSAYKKWVLQLNIYRYLIYKCLNYDVVQIFVHAFIRDWNRNRSEYMPGYPEYPSETFDIPVYSFDSIEKYIRSRVDLHFIAEQKYLAGEEIPVCEPDDRWMRPEVWKIKKHGAKRSLKNFVIKDDADALNARVFFEEKSKSEPKLTIEVIEGEDVRCVNYCAVNMYCKYYIKKYVETKELESKKLNNAGGTDEFIQDSPDSKGPEFEFDF